MKSPAQFLYTKLKNVKNYCQGLSRERLTPSSPLLAAFARSGDFDRSKFIVRWLDSLRTHVDFALRAVMRRVHKHIQDHGTPVRIGSVLPRRNMPLALKFLRSDLRQRGDHIVERLIEQLQHSLFIRRRRLAEINRKRRRQPGELIKSDYIAHRDMHHLLAKSHLVRIWFERIKLGGHGFRHSESEQLRDLPVADKLIHLDDRFNRSCLIGSTSSNTQQTDQDPNVSGNKSDPPVLPYFCTEPVSTIDGVMQSAAVLQVERAPALSEVEGISAFTGPARERS